MKKLTVVLAMCAASGCGDDTGSTGPEGGQDAGGDYEVNLDCPEFVDPIDGPYAPKGDCCYRKDNHAANADVPAGELGQLEYRAASSTTTNHPMTVGLDAVIADGVMRSERESSNLLIRLSMPSDGEGGVASGMGSARVGSGTANCDGTYSFFSDTAAVTTDSSDDASRWNTTPVPTVVDIDAATGVEAAKPVWKDNINRNLAYSPAVSLETGEYTWDMVTQGFELTQTPHPSDTGSAQCWGAYGSDGLWKPEAEYVAYMRMEENDASLLPNLAFSLCQLFSFGLLVAPAEGEPPLPSCLGDRCEPGSADCPWLKLPDSLCPNTDGDRDMWGCHVGDPNNEDGVATNCTMDAPTGVLDPDEGADNEGQCCDPLAMGTDGLPPCNAWRTVSMGTFIGVEITDKDHDGITQLCVR